MANYLSVPDLVWMNLRVTGAKQDYDFARLEEAVFLQYSHGSAEPAEARVGRFLTEFVEKKPFRAGNKATAVLAALTYCSLNGLAPDFGADGLDGWIRAGAPAAHADHDHTATVQHAATDWLGRLWDAIKELAENEPVLNLVS